MSWRKGNRLHLVSEGAEPTESGPLLDEVKATLGIAYVPACFRAYAAYPRFFAVQWQRIRPLLGTREFFELAARLRAEAYTLVHNYFPVPSLATGLNAVEALPVVDLLGYVEPVMLLMHSLQLQSFEGPVGSDGVPHPVTPVSYSLLPHFVEADTCTGPSRRVLDEMRRILELPFPPDHHRALAQWPELFSAYWRALRPAVQSPVYERVMSEIRHSAWSWAQQVPGQVDMEFSQLQEEGMTVNEISTVTHLAEALEQAAASSLLNLTFAKIGIEGGNRSQSQSSDIARERVA